jgi:small subunit ribosomal protein S20
MRYRGIFEEATKVANHKSAEKRNRQNIVRRERNRSVRTQVRTETKKLHAAIGTGDETAVESQLRLATKQLNKAASKGVMKKKTASRRIGRLAKAANKLGN